MGWRKGRWLKLAGVRLGLWLARLKPGQIPAGVVGFYGLGEGKERKMKGTLRKITYNLLLKTELIDNGINNKVEVSKWQPFLLAYFP